MAEEHQAEQPYLFGLEELRRGQLTERSRDPSQRAARWEYSDDTIGSLPSTTRGYAEKLRAKRPDLWRQVCAGEMSLNSACQMAKIVKTYTYLMMQPDAVCRACCAHMTKAQVRQTIALLTQALR